MVGLDADMNRDDECDNIGLGCALEHFSEVDDVLNMIDNVKNIYNTPALEGEYDKLYTILKQYYEQPHLLDPHLDKILAKFLELIKDKDSPFELKHATFNYMYQIIRVRGYKVVIRHLPHEVNKNIIIIYFFVSALLFIISDNFSIHNTQKTNFILNNTNAKTVCRFQICLQF